jgi:hypothetical protein
MCFVYIDSFNGSSDEQYDNTIIGSNSGGENKQIHLVIRKKKIYFGFYCNDIASETALTERTWYHVCCSYDMGTRTLKIYLDGKLDCKSEGRHSPLQGNSETFFSQYAGGRCLNGDIADFKIVPKALMIEKDVVDHAKSFPNFCDKENRCGAFAVDSSEDAVVMKLNSLKAGYFLDALVHLCLALQHHIHLRRRRETAFFHAIALLFHFEFDFEIF